MIEGSSGIMEFGVVCGRGGFERQIHEKGGERQQSRASPILQPQHRSITTHAKRHVPRALMNDTYSLPSPKEPRSSIHAKRRRRRRHHRRRRRHVVWS